ncbi:hypothetical protein HNY73_002409 [Argiope bruennichi]|uniref:Uncharacterized protein n=1 Tax=Argiope bruennichi TaxID=94029 RepID=A0A8T0FUH6_ARGBR|nr:hypothetical protein HNY73_002409 [Argiope bruennichi]
MTKVQFLESSKRNKYHHSKEQDRTLLANITRLALIDETKSIFDFPQFLSSQYWRQLPETKVATTSPNRIVIHPSSESPAPEITWTL